MAFAASAGSMLATFFAEGFGCHRSVVTELCQNLHQFGERDYTGLCGEASDVINLLVWINSGRCIVDVDINDIRCREFPHIVNGGATGVPVPRIEQQPKRSPSRQRRQVLTSHPLSRRRGTWSLCGLFAGPMNSSPIEWPVVFENLGNTT